MDIIDGLLEKIFFQHTGRTREGPQATGAFRTTQITTGGGLKRDGKGKTPLYRLFHPSAQIITGEKFRSIPYPPHRKFGQKVDTIVEVEAGHVAKIQAKLILLLKRSLLQWLILMKNHSFLFFKSSLSESLLTEFCHFKISSWPQWHERKKRHLMGG